MKTYFAQHVLLLLTRHKLEHRVIKLTEVKLARGSYADRAVYAPHVTDALTYAVALHEIGHFVVASRRGTLLDEAMVWAWVRDAAILWTPQFDSLVAYCLKHYAEQEFIDPRISALFDN